MSQYYSAKDVIRAACDIYGVSPERLVCRASRDEDKASARMVAAWILRNCGHPYRRSWPTIARALGYAGHDTPLRNYAKMERESQKWNEPLLATMRLLEARACLCFTGLTGLSIRAATADPDAIVTQLTRDATHALKTQLSPEGVVDR